MPSVGVTSHCRSSPVEVIAINRRGRDPRKLRVDNPAIGVVFGFHVSIAQPDGIQLKVVVSLPEPGLIDALVIEGIIVANGQRGRSNRRTYSAIGRSNSRVHLRPG